MCAEIMQESKVLREENKKRHNGNSDERSGAGKAETDI